MKFEWLNKLKDDVLTVTKDTWVDKCFILNIILHYFGVIIIFISSTICIIPIILSAIVDHICTLYCYIRDYRGKKHRIKAIRDIMSKYEQQFTIRRVIYS